MTGVVGVPDHGGDDRCLAALFPSSPRRRPGPRGGPGYRPNARYSRTLTFPNGPWGDLCLQAYVTHRRPSENGNLRPHPAIPAAPGLRPTPERRWETANVERAERGRQGYSAANPCRLNEHRPPVHLVPDPRGLLEGGNHYTEVDHPVVHHRRRPAGHLG